MIAVSKLGTQEVRRMDMVTYSIGDGSKQEYRDFELDSLAALVFMLDPERRLFKFPSFNACSMMSYICSF